MGSVVLVLSSGQCEPSSGKGAPPWGRAPCCPPQASAHPPVPAQSLSLLAWRPLSFRVSEPESCPLLSCCLSSPRSALCPEWAPEGVAPGSSKCQPSARARRPLLPWVVTTGPASGAPRTRPGWVGECWMRRWGAGAGSRGQLRAVPGLGVETRARAREGTRPSGRGEVGETEPRSCAVMCPRPVPMLLARITGQGSGLSQVGKGGVTGRGTPEPCRPDALGEPGQRSCTSWRPGAPAEPTSGICQGRGTGGSSGRPGAGRGVHQLCDPLKALARSPTGLGVGGEGQVGEGPVSVGYSRLETEHRACKSNDLKRHLQKPNYGAD